MIQIEVYLKGERDYSQIYGPTGPLVLRVLRSFSHKRVLTCRGLCRYPAGHVYIYRALHSLTSAGKDVRLAQYIFGALYILSLLLTCCVYWVSGRQNWVIGLLATSKRLHSIYVLRLFNDCWSVVFAQAAVLAMQTGWDESAVWLFR